MNRIGGGTAFRLLYQSFGLRLLVLTVTISVIVVSYFDLFGMGMNLLDIGINFLGSGFQTSCFRCVNTVPYARGSCTIEYEKKNILSWCLENCVLF